MKTTHPVGVILQTIRYQMEMLTGSLNLLETSLEDMNDRAAAALEQAAGQGTVRGVQPRKKRMVSAAARKRMAEATRKRWADYRAMQEASQEPVKTNTKKVKVARKKSAAAAA